MLPPPSTPAASASSATGAALPVLTVLSASLIGLAIVVCSTAIAVVVARHSPKPPAPAHASEGAGFAPVGTATRRGWTVASARARTPERGDGPHVVGWIP